MQNNFECIFKLVVALTFLMCVFNVCCLFALSVFLFNVLHYIFIFFFFFLFVLFSRTKDSKKKEKKKEKKERKLNHELNFLYGNLFGPIIFSS